MLYLTHLLFSIFAGLWLFPYFSLSPFIFYPAIMFFGLLPDIDESRSFLGKRVKAVGWFFRHRGLFHSAIFGAVVGILAYFISPELGAASLIGYFSHLSLDALNYQGIKPLYPFSGYRIKGFIKTGGMIEQLLLVALAAGIILTVL